jgi:hypothetical protein
VAAARVAATTVNAEARCGQGASVVARVQVWWPRRAEMRWGPRSAGVDEPDVSRLQCACGGNSGCERQRAEVTQPPMSKLIDAVVCVTGHKCAVARRPSDPEDVSKLVRPYAPLLQVQELDV